MFRRSKRRNTVRALFEQHFGPVAVDDLITAGRTFPVTAALDEMLFAGGTLNLKLLGGAAS